MKKTKYGKEKGCAYCGSKCDDWEFCSNECVSNYNKKYTEQYNALKKRKDLLLLKQEILELNENVFMKAIELESKGIPTMKTDDELEIIVNRTVENSPL